MTSPGELERGRERKARELLAAEYERVGDDLNAGRIMHGQYVCEEVDLGLNAISSALADESEREWQPIETAPKSEWVWIWSDKGPGLGFIKSDGEWLTEGDNAEPVYWQRIVPPTTAEHG